MKHSSAAATVAILSLVLAAILVSAPVERVLRGRAATALDLFRAGLEGSTGFSMSYRGMSPSILKSVSFTGLDIHSPGEKSYVRARRAWLYYDLGALLRGRLDRLITGFGLEGVEARLDAADLPRLRGLLPGGGGGGGARLPELTFDGGDLAIELTGFAFGTVRARIERFTLDGTLEEPSLGLAASLSLAPAGFPAIEARLSGDCLVSRGLDRLRGELSLGGRAGEIGVGTQRLALALSLGPGNSRFELRKVRDAAPLDASLIMEEASGKAHLSLLMEGYSPGDLLTLSGSLAAVDPWLSLPLTGRLEAEAALSDLSRLSWRVDLRSSPSDAEALPMAGYDLVLDARGDLRGADIAEARLAGQGLSLSYAGGFGFPDLSPAGSLSVRVDIAGLESPLETELSLFGGGTRYAIVADRLAAGGSELRDLVADIALDAPLPGSGAAEFGLSFRLPAGEESGAAAAARFSGEAVPEASAGRVVVSGNVDLRSGTGFEAQVGLAELDFGALRPLGAGLLDVGTLTALSSLRVDGELVVRSDFRHLSYSAADLAVASPLLPGAFAILSFSGTERDLRLRSSKLSYGGVVASASGSASFPESGDFAFALAVEVADLPYAVDGTIGDGSISLSGDYGLELSLRPADGAWEVEARAKSFPLPLPGIAGAVGLAAFDMRGRFVDRADWRADFDYLALDPAGAALGGVGLPSLELAGSFGPKGGTASSLALRDGVSRLSGVGTFAWELFGHPSLGATVDLSAPSGERIRLEGRVDESMVLASLDFTRAPLSRFIPPGELAGYATGRARLSGTVADPRIEAQVELVEGLRESLPIVISLSGDYAGGLLALREGQLRWRGFEFSAVTGSYNLSKGRASAAGRFRYAIGSAPLTCDVTATALIGSSSSPGIRVDGILSRIALRSIAIDSWPFSVESRPERFSIEGGPDGEFAFQSLPTGAFSLKTVHPFPILAEARGRLLRGELEARADSLAFYLPSILPIIGPLPVSIPSGYIEGSLDIRGALADPEFSGLLRVTGIAVDVPDYLVDRIGPLDGNLVADGKRLILSPASTRVGEGSAAIGFEMGLDGWIPNTFIATLKSGKDAPLHVKTQILGILVDGRGFADLRIEVDPTTLRLGGDLTLEKSSVILSPGIFGAGMAGGGPPSILLDVSMRLGFARGVMLYFPAREFPVVSGQVDPASLLSIRYDQASGRVDVRGNAVLRGGDVFYIQRDFFLRNATIRFSESAEKFDPLVTLHAELRDSNEAGPVLVTLRADNAPIADFKPRLTSDPPMTELQIVSLLGGRLVGVGEEGQAVDIRRAAIAGAEFLPPSLNVTKAFEARVRETLGLDVFYLSTRILQRLLFEAAGASSLGETGSLGSYLDETSAYAGKYLGEGIFAHAQARLSDNPLEPSRPLKLDSELGVEFDTPFGLLTWSVSPKDPQSLFIGDQSVGLRWRFSY